MKIFGDIFLLGAAEKLLKHKNYEFYRTKDHRSVVVIDWSSKELTLPDDWDELKKLDSKKDS